MLQLTYDGVRAAIPFATLDLESIAADVVTLAMKAGAADAEAVIREGDEFSVNVRLAGGDAEGVGIARPGLAGLRR